MLRDRFDRHESYASLAVELEEVAKALSDTALAVGALVYESATQGSIPAALRAVLAVWDELDAVGAARLRRRAR